MSVTHRSSDGSKIRVEYATKKIGKIEKNNAMDDGDGDGSTIAIGSPKAQ